MNDIFSYRKNAREIKEEKKHERIARKKTSTKQRRQNRGFSTESAARRGCGTINRYGQLLESTSRVQFAAPHQRVDANSRGEEKGRGNEESPREAEG